MTPDFLRAAIAVGSAVLVLAALGVIFLVLGGARLGTPRPLTPEDFEARRQAYKRARLELQARAKGKAGDRTPGGGVSAA